LRFSSQIKIKEEEGKALVLEDFVASIREQFGEDEEESSPNVMPF